jgi:uncharacterized protein (TIGR03663 family)
MMATEQRTQGWLDSVLRIPLRLSAETLVFGAILILAIVSRFYDVGARVMSHDETTHVYYSWQLYMGRGFEHNPLMHGPMQFHLWALSYFLFGDNNVSPHIPTAFLGVVSVGMLWLFRRWLGRTGALVAAALMLVSPYMLFYSRYIREDPFVIPEALLMFWALFRYFEGRELRWLVVFGAALALHFTTKETAFIYTAQLLVFMGLYLAWELLKERWPSTGLKVAFFAGLAAAAVGGGAAAAIMLYERATAGAVPENGLPPAPASPVVMLGLLLAILGGILAFVALVLAFRGRLRTDFPALDIIVVAGTVMLPQVAALPAKVLGWDPIAYQDQAAMLKTSIVVVIFAAISIGVGLLWDWRRWLVVSALFWGIFTVFYTTMFTYGFGLFTGLVGSLGYWIVQQGVERGSQPWYFYPLIQIPIYEYLPAIGALIALGMGLKRWWSGNPADATPSSEKGSGLPVMLFIGYWCASSLGAYTVAGEKMPWLTVHIALPLILAAGWAIGRFLESIDWGALRRARAWLEAGLMVLFLVVALRALGYLLGSTPPFQGTTLEQLRPTTGFLVSFAVAVAVGVYLGLERRSWSGRGLFRAASVAVLGILFVLTARTAFRAAYVNYDDATEYLVYAHGAPGVRDVMQQVQDLSERTTGGLAIDVAYDSDTSYPFMWYLRDYPNAHFFGDAPGRDLLDYPLIMAGAKSGNWQRLDPILGRRYFVFEYNRLWWPNQDYFNLTWDRIRYALTSPEYRAALWDIWLNRDYTAYSALTQEDMSLTNWQPSERMRLYVRKDVAALVWDYGVASATLEPAALEDPYAKGMVQLAAQPVIGGPGDAPGQFSGPRGMAVAPDGSLFVADTLNNRIQHLAADGTVIAVWGTFADVAKGDAPGGTLNQPWDVAVAPDGTIYVADTWNHRIQHFTADGKSLGMFGQPGSGESPTAFWGPRGVAVDARGRIFVVDTYNKRVVLFDAQGQFVGQFGGGGAGEGQLNEPVGLALDAQGRVYVADTWNQRVQVFEEKEPGQFEPVSEWPVDGWYGQSLDNKPYLTVSPGGTVCLTDPEGYRVLCFTSDGTYVRGWGESGTSESAFGLPDGIAFAPDGTLWVVDTGNNRLMHFAPDLK